MTCRYVCYSCAKIVYQATIFVHVILLNYSRLDNSQFGQTIRDCLLEVREWMDANFLKLNNAKTELVLFGSRQHLGKVTLDGLNVCDIIVRSQDVAKDLGVLWDSQMTMIKLQTCARHLHCIFEIS